MIDVLDHGCLGPEPALGETGWLDVCRRLQRRLSDEHFQRFAQGMRMWAATAGLQILNHTQSQSVDVRPYKTIRRHTSGTFPCLDVLDATNAGPITPAEYHRSEVKQLCLHTNNIICWSNDIQSLPIEVRQPGQFRNLVVIHAMRGLSLQDSIDRVADEVRQELAEFQLLAAQVELSASRELRGFISGLKNWIRGYQDWVDVDTRRYHPAYVIQDANDSRHFA